MTSAFAVPAEEAFQDGDYVKAQTLALLAIRDELWQINDTLERATTNPNMRLIRSALKNTVIATEE